eukprot:3868685-Amphidinium_carterae.1
MHTCHTFPACTLPTMQPHVSQATPRIIARPLMSVVPPEVTTPLAVIDSLFAQHVAAGGKSQGECWGERQHFQEVLGLQDETKLAHIPCLNGVSLRDEIPPFTLVRYRCLIQDVFEPEMYTDVFQESPATKAPICQPCSERYVTAKYRDWASPSAGCELVEATSLSQRA